MFPLGHIPKDSYMDLRSSILANWFPNIIWYCWMEHKGYCCEPMRLNFSFGYKLAEMLLKCWFWFSKCGAGPEILHFKIDYQVIPVIIVYRTHFEQQGTRVYKQHLPAFPHAQGRCHKHFQRQISITFCACIVIFEIV